MFEYQKKEKKKQRPSISDSESFVLPYCILRLIYRRAVWKGPLAKVHVVTNLWTTEHYVRALQELSLMVIRRLLSMIFVMTHKLCN